MAEGEHETAAAAAAAATGPCCSLPRCAALRLGRRPRPRLSPVSLGAAWRSQRPALDGGALLLAAPADERNERARRLALFARLPSSSLASRPPFCARRLSPLRPLTRSPWFVSASTSPCPPSPPSASSSTTASLSTRPTSSTSGPSSLSLLLAPLVSRARSAVIELRTDGRRLPLSHASPSVISFPPPPPTLCPLRARPCCFARNPPGRSAAASPPSPRATST